MSKLLLLFTSLVFITNAFAQVRKVPVKFDGQIRVRSEADGRDFNSDSDINTYSLLRTRFGATMRPRKNVNVYFQIQDSRALGREPSTVADISNLDVHQAFLQMHYLWQQPIHLKIGRQEMIYGNERLIGAVGFSNVGRSFDGIKLTFGRNRNFDLFSMIINERNTPVTGAATPGSTAGGKSTDFKFHGAYFKHGKNRKYRLDAYGFYESNSNETVPGENDLNRVTIGGYGKRAFSRSLDFETELAWQFGKRRGQVVSAYMFTGSVGYTSQSPQNPSVRVGIDYLSGMDANDDNYKAFDTIFATNHKFYGYMDYFINVPVNTNARGLRDFTIKAKVPYGRKWNFNAHFHNFRTTKGNEKNLGNELDLILNYKYNSAASFVFGLAFFIPGDSLQQAFANNDVGLWSYTTLLVSF